MAIRTAKNFIGLEDVIRNLNKEIHKIKNRSMAGLIKAAIIIRRDMDKTPPLIPVDLGNLRASSFIVTGKGQMDGTPVFGGPQIPKFVSDHVAMIQQEKAIVGSKLLVSIGFSASYAAQVEADTHTKRKRPGSGGGFFRSSVVRNKALIINTIKKEAQIK